MLSPWVSPPGDIGGPAELWILSKLLRSLALRPHSVLQPLFGANGISVQSELPRGSTRRNTGIDFSFSFLYLLCEAQSWRPPSFCSNRNQLWPMPTTPSEPATKWSRGQGHSYLGGGACRDIHLSPSSPTPTLPNSWLRVRILRGLLGHLSSLDTLLYLYRVEDHKPLAGFSVILISLKCSFSDGTLPC